jgi:hypothetical protein
MGLEQANDGRSSVRGKQAPQRLRPHAPVGRDGFVCFHSRAPNLRVTTTWLSKYDSSTN